MVLLSTVCALVLIATASTVGLGLSHLRSSQSPAATSNQIRVVPQNGSGTGSGSSSATGADQQAVAQQVEKAIVDIDTVTPSGAAAGTGMILTSSGEVLTNNHVIAGATRVTVTLPLQGRTYSATVVGADPSHDVALLQIQGASNLSTVTVADSSTVSVGEPVIAIGNAFGRGGTPSVTTGSVTATNQDITASDGNGPGEQLSGLLQIDAAISPGDSGGAVVNSAGQVIGMITAGEQNGFRRRAASTTVGYAIPSSTAVSVVNQIRSGAPNTTATPSTSSSAFLGVQVRDVDASTANRLGLRDASGALVVGVVSGSPADAAGLSADSVITAFNGKVVDSASTLGSLIHALKPGTRVSLTWIDGSGSHTATATLG